jgi:hypothetical protein
MVTRDFSKAELSAVELSQAPYIRGSESQMVKHAHSVNRTLCDVCSKPIYNVSRLPTSQKLPTAAIRRPRPAREISANFALIAFVEHETQIGMKRATSTFRRKRQ